MFSDGLLIVFNQKQIFSYIGYGKILKILFSDTYLKGNIMIDQTVKASNDEINVSVEPADKSHKNFMGGISYDVTNPITKLRMVAASSFFGEPQFYVGGSRKVGSMILNRNANISMDYLMDVLSGVIVPKMYNEDDTTASIMEKIIDDALDFDVEATLRVAASLRNDDLIRTTPQVIMVRAANHPNAKGTGLIREYAKHIIRRADEPAVQLAYQNKAFGRKAIPNQLKRSWKDYLSSISEYSLAKYKMSNREVKTIDVVRVSHAHSDAIDKLVSGDLTLNQSTWESIISTNGSTKENWLKAIDKMGHMALLRNINNFIKNGVESENYIDKLVGSAKNGKQLPFRYYTALNAVDQQTATGKDYAEIANALSECIDIVCDDLPHFNGNVAVLCDNSGSAHGAFTSEFGKVSVADISNLTAVITARVSDNGVVMPFGDRLLEYVPDNTKSVLEQHEDVRKLGEKVGGGTENGLWLFWKDALKNKKHYDHVFVYSDMQAGHGDLYGYDVDEEFIASAYARYGSEYIDVPKLIKRYREQVNPDVFVYLVQVAGYSDTILPEFYDRTFILGGWSGNVLKFAKKMQEIYEG